MFAVAVGSDWNQWRGPNRDGAAPSSPPLIDRLPSEGLKPLWLSEKISAGGNGGWGSPVVAHGKVYLFAHYQMPKVGVKLPPPKYPALKEEEQKRLDPAELQKYEQARQEEEYARRTASPGASGGRCRQITARGLSWPDWDRPQSRGHTAAGNRVGTGYSQRRRSRGLSQNLAHTGAIP